MYTMIRSLKLVSLQLVCTMLISCDVNLVNIPSSNTYAYIGQDFECYILNKRTGEFIKENNKILEAQPKDELIISITPIFVPDDPFFDYEAFDTKVLVFDIEKEIDYAPCEINLTVPELQAGTYPITCSLSYYNESDNNIYSVSYISNTSYILLK